MTAVRVISPNGSPIHIDEATRHLRVTDTEQDSVILRLIASATASAEAATNRPMLHGRYTLTLNEFPSSATQPSGRGWLASDIITLPLAPVTRIVSIVYIEATGAAQTLPASNYTLKEDCGRYLIAPVYGYSWPATLPQWGSVVITFDAGHASPFTADATANTLTVSGPMAWAVGDVVRVSNSGGALPSGLSAATSYYIKTASAGVYTLSATSGGATVDLKSAGSGYSFIGEIPPGMVDWCLLRIAALYENREQTSVIERGQMQSLPFADELLAQQRVYVP